MPFFAAQINVVVLLARLAAADAAAPDPKDQKAQAKVDAPHAYLMVRCTNSQKSGQYKDVMMATTAKTMQVRADEGDIAGWIFAQSVIPSGAASSCDFMQMNLYRSFPPQRSPIDQYLVKANVGITRDQWYAKLGEVSRLMRMELWRGIDEVGQAKKGQFIRVDYLKVPPARRNEWARFEQGRGKTAAAAKIKQGDWAAWLVQELMLPGGTGEPYNARALTVFPDWNSLGRPGGPGDGDSLAKLRETVRSELYEIVEVVRPAAAQRN